MTNEELTKIAWTRELTDERVRVAAAYWLDCSPHERTEADGIILARYAREVMVKLADQKAITELAVKSFNDIKDFTASVTIVEKCKTALSEIERISNGTT